MSILSLKHSRSKITIQGLVFLQPERGQTDFSRSHLEIDFLFVCRSGVDSDCSGDSDCSDCKNGLSKSIIAIIDFQKSFLGFRAIRVNPSNPSRPQIRACNIFFLSLDPLGLVAGRAFRASDY